MVVITGLGRCGTSILTKFITEMGFDTGLVTWNDSVNAGYEDSHTMIINTCVMHLSRLGALTETDIVKIKDNLRVVAHLDAVKDPRFTQNPLLLKLWHEVYPDMKLLILSRDFAQIEKSRKRMAEIEPILERTAFTKEMLSDWYHRFMIEVYYLRIPFILLQYPYFIQDYTGVYDACRFVGLKFDKKKGKKKWGELVDLTKVHIYE